MVTVEVPDDPCVDDDFVNVVDSQLPTSLAILLSKYELKDPKLSKTPSTCIWPPKLNRFQNESITEANVVDSEHLLSSCVSTKIHRLKEFVLFLREFLLWNKVLHPLLKYISDRYRFETLHIHHRISFT